MTLTDNLLIQITNFSVCIFFLLVFVFDLIGFQCTEDWLVFIYDQPLPCESFTADCIAEVIEHSKQHRSIKKKNTGQRSLLLPAHPVCRCVQTRTVTFL